MAFKLRLHIIILIFCWPATEVFSQESIPDIFKNYQETVWLDCERHLYLPGEIIRFHARVFEKDTYQNSSLSSNLRIELLNSMGEPMDQQNIQLDNAGLKGFIQLPHDTKTGYYYLRAYTNWMRNFPTSNYAQVALKIVNPNDPLPEIKEEENVIVTPNFNPYLEVIVENQKLSVSIRDEAFENSDNIRLVMHQSYTVILDTLFTNGLNTNLSILKNDLPYGIFQISLLGNNNRIIAKRLWSFYEPETKRIDINLSDSLLSIRNSYSIDIPNSTEVQGLTVSIGLEEPNNPLKNFIPGLPGWNCNAEIPNSSEAFKSWLLHNSYPDDQVLKIIGITQDNLNNQQFLHLPETQSGIISGKVIDRETNEGQANTGVCITVLNDNYFDAASTDENGQFFFVLNGYSGASDFILNLSTIEDSSIQIEVMPFFDSNAIPDDQKLTLTKAELAFLQKQNINQQLKNIYGAISVLPSSHSPEVKARETFFHPPDYKIVVDKYIKLANVGEVIYEVVPSVRVRRKNGREYLRVYNDHPNAADFETLVLLDGIPLTDQTILLDLPPERIEIIEVKNKLYIHGRSIFSAIVNFVSPNKDYAGLELPENSVLSTMDLPVPIINDRFILEDKAESLPSLENNLLWHSKIREHSDHVEFNTKDLIGVFRIYIQGFDVNGKWRFGTRQIIVD